MQVRARAALVAVLVALAALVVDTTFAGSLSWAAAAKPRPLASELATARAKLAALDESLDVADEQYRDGQLALARAKQGQQAADRALVAGKSRRAALQGQVDQIAVTAYETGGTGDVLVASEDVNLAESTAVLSQFAAGRTNILHRASAAQYDLAVAQAAADQSTAAADAAARALARTRASIVLQVAQHKALVDSLIQRQHTLEAIAAEKARLAEIAAEKARAEHAAAAKRAAQAAADAAAAAAQQAAQEAAAAKAAAQIEAAQRAADEREALAAKAQALRDAQSAAAATSAATTGGDSTGAASTGGDSAGNGDPPAAPPDAGTPSSRAADAVAAAYQQLGAPYDWAADGPGSFDCSGLTAYAWERAGVDLPHSSQAQFEVGAHVSRSQLAPGDLVFFGSPIHHVGIYVGNGQMIDAPQTGDVVRVQSIGRPDYAGAVRVTG